MFNYHMDKQLQLEDTGNGISNCVQRVSTEVKVDIVNDRLEVFVIIVESENI